MRSDNDQVVGNSTESTREEDKKELFYDTRSDERVKENDGNMLGQHSSECKIDSKNEEKEQNLDGLEDSPVFYTDKNVTACDLPETVVSNYKEHTHNIVKDICIDENVAKMEEKDSVISKSSEDSKFDESVGIHNQENVTVSGGEVKNDSEVSYEVCREKSSQEDVVATSGFVFKEVLTLREIISMEDSQKLRNSKKKKKETEQEKTEEPVAESLRYLAFEREESTKPLLNDGLEDSYDPHHLVFQNERSIPEADSGLAQITYSGAISVSGNLSNRSDGSTVSAHSFAFPILHSEWNSSPERMAKVEKRQQPRKEKGWRHYSLLLCCRF